MKRTEAYNRLIEKGIRPSLQRIAIMDYLITHDIHPNIEDVYKGLCDKIPTLSKTTVYNTLRMLSEHHAAQMITIDDHRVCYDGNIKSHVHFLCKRCGRVFDLYGENAPQFDQVKVINGHIVQERQLYYRGICEECAKLEKAKESAQAKVKKAQ